MSERPFDPAHLEEKIADFHHAFVLTSAMLAKMKPEGSAYWTLLHYTQSLLEISNRCGDASFEWDSYQEFLRDRKEED